MRTVRRPTPREKQEALKRLALMEETLRNTFELARNHEQFERCCEAYAECVISKARITSFPTTI